MKLKLFVLLFLTLALVGCNAGQGRGSQDLTVFAAASLTDAFNEMLAWVKANAKREKINAIFAHKLDRETEDVSATTPAVTVGPPASPSAGSARPARRASVTTALASASLCTTTPSSGSGASLPQGWPFRIVTARPRRPTPLRGPPRARRRQGPPPPTRRPPRRGTRRRQRSGRRRRCRWRGTTMCAPAG